MIPTWPYYTLTTDGKLVDDDGNDAFPGQRFESEWEAIDWLEQNDIPGSVR